MAQAARPTALAETLSHESAASTATDSDRPLSDRSDSLAGLDPASPPTSVESEPGESAVGLAPPNQNPRSPQAQLQAQTQPQTQPPRPPRTRRSRNSHDEAGQGTELDTFSQSEPEARSENNDIHSVDGRRSSHSSTKTSDSWLTFITGSISETLKRPSSNWALLAFLVHYFLLLGFGVAQLFLAFWTWKTSGSPNSAQDTAVKMQKLFGELAHEDAKQAHEDAKKLLAAMASKSAEEAKWEPIFNRFIEITKACVGVANQNQTDTKCVDVWEAANLNSSSDYTPVVAPSYALQKRKFEEIRQVFDEYESAARSGTASPQWDMAIQLTIIFCGTLLLFGILAVVLFYNPFRKAFFSLLRKLRKIRPRRSRKLAEKPETTHAVDSETTAVSSSVGFRGDSRATLRLAAPGARHLPNSIWEVAAQGLQKETKALREQKVDFDIDEVHERYGTLLAAAARSGNIDLVSDILTWGPNVQREGGHYHNALQSGAYSGNPLMVRKLLGAGARDLSVGAYFGTALNAAAEKGSSEMLVDLLRHTSNPSHWVNVPGGLHGKAVIAAASRGQGKMVLDLLAHDANLDDTNDSGTTALHAAAAANHFMMVKTLLDRGADKDLISTIHGTALHAACRGKFSNIGLLLIERGASVIIKDQNSRTVLHEASKNGLTELVNAILSKNDTMINAQDADGNTALHHAAIGGHAGITSALIKHKIDVSIGDKFKAQALFRAAGCHHLRVVRILLEDGEADPNAVDCFNQTALHGPAETEDVSVQHILIKHGANVNAVGNMHRTALHEACNMGRYNNVKLLLSTPEINVNIVDDDQTTPLCRALCSTDGRHEDKCIDQRIPIMLLDYKDLDWADVFRGPEIDAREDIDVNLCNGLAIQEASRRNLIDVVRKMLEEHDANIHLPGGKYGGVLQAAAIGGDVEVLNLLLDRKANANLQGGEYGTPLAAAAAYGNVAAVKALLESGADPTVSGVGKYGSAFNSVCKSLKVEEEGLSKIIQLSEQVKEILKASGGEVGSGAAGTLHESDRWQLMPSGWTWNAAGEL